MPAKLVCVKGSYAGKEIILEVGRAPRVRIGTDDSDPVMQFSWESECWHLSCDAEFEINGHAREVSILNGGDEIICQDNVFRYESDEIISIDYMSETRDESEEYDEEDIDGSHRQRRRISASHEAVLSTPENQKQGLLGRVGKAFRRRDERLEKLEALEEERRELLAVAGRFALENQGGLGLPREFLVKIFKGTTIEISYEQLTKSHIDHYRQLRDRLLFLDADIDACRIDMGLAPENRNTLEKLHLRADHEAEEENAFQAMDGVATVENEFDVNSASENFELASPSDDTESKPAAMVDEEDGTEIISRRRPRTETEDSDRPSDEEGSESSGRQRASGRRRSGVSVRRRRRTR